MTISDVTTVSNSRARATLPALIRRHDTLLAIAGGVLLATLFIVFGLPFLLTGHVPALAVKIALLVCGFTAFGWFVWRMRGDAIRAHGGWQGLPPVLVMAVVTALLLLAACSNNPTDPARRTNAQTTNTTAAQTGGKSAEDAEWARVLSAPGPTAVHYPAKCPGATNAEIDAALNSNKPMTCGGGK